MLRGLSPQTSCPKGLPNKLPVHGWTSTWQDSSESWPFSVACLHTTLSPGVSASYLGLDHHHHGVGGGQQGRSLEKITEENLPSLTQSSCPKHQPQSCRMPYSPGQHSCPCSTASDQGTHITANGSPSRGSALRTVTGLMCPHHLKQPTQQTSVMPSEYSVPGPA